MALFWSVVAGEAEQQIEVPTTSVASVRMVAVEVPDVTPLPPGEYAGQPLVWDGDSAWGPGASIVVSAIASQPDGQLTIASGDGGMLLTSGLAPINLSGPGCSVSLNINGANMAVSSTERLFLSVDGAPVFDADINGIAFLGKSGTVLAQSITGGTTQQQVDSLVDALTEFGLCSDGRTVINPGVVFNALEGVDLSARVIEVIPASAPSGIYVIGFSVNCRTPQTGGTYGSNLTFTTPEGQASSLGWGNVQVTSAGVFSTGTTSTMPRVVAFGTGTACSLTLTPAAVTGSPVYDFYTTAQFLAPIA